MSALTVVLCSVCQISTLRTAFEGACFTFLISQQDSKREFQSYSGAYKACVMACMSFEDIVKAPISLKLALSCNLLIIVFLIVAILSRGTSLLWIQPDHSTLLPLSLPSNWTATSPYSLACSLKWQPTSCLTLGWLTFSLVSLQGSFGLQDYEIEDVIFDCMCIVHTLISSPRC